MNKIIETKELDPKTVDNSKDTFQGKVSCRDGDYDITKVKGVHWVDGKLMWYAVPDRSEMDCCEYWDIAEEIVKRYPRDVPDDAVPLPDDKPFLAFLGKGGEWLVQKTKGREPSLWVYKKNDDTWINYDNNGYTGCVKPIYYTLDISTDWAAKEFPEIVEAMEYEPIKNMNGELIRHKLGGVYYDLNWKRIEPSRWVEIIAVLHPRTDGEVESKSRDREEEPPDFKEFSEKLFSHPNAIDSKLAFEAGKKRGKWEARQKINQK